jgi:hypothetical protein
MSYKDEHHHRKEELRYKKLGLYVNGFAAIAAAASAAAAFLALRGPQPTASTKTPSAATQKNTPPTQSSPANKTAPSKQPKIFETPNLPPIPLDSSLPDVETNPKNPNQSDLPSQIEEKQSIPKTEKSTPKQEETRPSPEVKIESKTQAESVEKKITIPPVESQPDKQQKINPVDGGSLLSQPSPSGDNSASTVDTKER